VLRVISEGERRERMGRIRRRNGELTDLMVYTSRYNDHSDPKKESALGSLAALGREQLTHHGLPVAKDKKLLLKYSPSDF